VYFSVNSPPSLEW